MKGQIELIAARALVALTNATADGAQAARPLSASLSAHRESEMRAHFRPAAIGPFAECPVLNARRWKADIGLTTSISPFATLEGTLDARLIAVDAQTGLPCSDFGQNGAVDISAGIGKVVHGMLSITSPPVIVQGIIVTRHQVLDGQTLDAPSGAIRGYDAVTGELAWAWDMARPDLTGMLLGPLL